MQHRSTLAGWLTAALLGASMQVGAQPVPSNKFVGILYSTWFDHVNGRPRGVAPTYPTDVPSPEFRYWADPAEGKYFSSDARIINVHADQLSAAGVDFILIDASNGNLSEDCQASLICRPNLTLLEQYTARRRNGLPTPKVVFLISDAASQFQALKSRFYDVYEKSLFFEVSGKPLVLTPSCSAAGLDTSFQCRATGGLTGDSAKWSFMEATPQPVYRRSHWPEQMAVSAAQQATYMNAPHARGRSYAHWTPGLAGQSGQNFLDQWGQVASHNPTFVIVKAWNEWVAQRLSVVDDKNCTTKEHPDGCFTDEFNPEFSNDIEPMKGGHQDLYLRLLTTQIRRYKRNAPTVVLRDPGSGIWTIKHGRGRLQLGASNFLEAFSWAAGAHYQPVVFDANGDGLSDMVLRDSSTGHWHIAHANGAGAYSHTRSFAWQAGAGLAPLAADLNRDGRVDLALRDAASGLWYFAVADGSGGYTLAGSFRWAPGDHYQPLLFDSNRDGTADLVLRDSNTGAWHFAASVAPFSFQHTKSFSWVAGRHYSPLASDFDCDGATDIALRDSSTGAIHLSNNSGDGIYSHQDNISGPSGAHFSISADGGACSNKAL